MKLVWLLPVLFIVLSSGKLVGAERHIRGLQPECSPDGKKAVECDAKAKSGRADKCCDKLTCDEDPTSSTFKMCVPPIADDGKAAGDWTKPVLIPPKELDQGVGLDGLDQDVDPCKLGEELASDVQALVDGIEYVNESPICTFPPSRSLIDVAFWLFTTAACEFVGGVGSIFDVVSGPIAESQIDKCLTLEELERDIGTALRQTLRLLPPDDNQIKRWLTQGLNGNFLFGDNCPENCIDFCNMQIGDSCLISTCQGAQCQGIVNQRCKSNKNIMVKTCNSFLNYDLQSNSDAINDLRNVMVERCLLVVDSVEQSCRDIFLNGGDGACNDLVNHDQAVWDRCIADCDEQQRSEKCNGSGCGECKGEDYFTECCSGDRLYLWLNCQHIQGSGNRFCCSAEMADLLPNEC